MIYLDKGAFVYRCASCGAQNTVAVDDSEAKNMLKKLFNSGTNVVLCDECGAARMFDTEPYNCHSVVQQNIRLKQSKDLPFCLITHPDDTYKCEQCGESSKLLYTCWPFFKSGLCLDCACQYFLKYRSIPLIISRYIPYLNNRIVRKDSSRGFYFSCPYCDVVNSIESVTDEVTPHTCPHCERDVFIVPWDDYSYSICLDEYESYS